MDTQTADVHMHNNGDVPGSPNTVREHSPNNDEANASIDLISQSMKAVVKKIQDLRHLGIEDHGLPLPKICVVGDQSTGKSSLIEGMSEIKVPRSAGCCTRCPLEINLSESELPDSPWTCRVLLMKKYIYDGSGRIKRATHAKPLGPWVGQDPEEFLFETLTDKSLVQETLKWAQLATLNPGRSYKDFMREDNTDTDETYTQVKFSPNVVRLDISAPGFPNLSFYDLPGVINVAEIDDEKYLVTLVENLVKEYIKADNCIALLTLPMTDDATNSSAARIIHDVSGARSRTLGVLTKPDRVQIGEGYNQWCEILRGQKFSVGHGYYVVRNNPDPLVDHATAREEELHFFARPPWTEELSEYGERFGTRRLQAALSKLLFKQIQDSLPRIIDQIIYRSRSVDDELRTLPDPPSANIAYILCQKLNVFTNKIKNHIDGGSPRYPFLKQWGQVADQFQKYLSASRPTVRVINKAPTRLPIRDGRASEAPNYDEECEVTYAQPAAAAQPALKRKAAAVNGDAGAKRVKKPGQQVAGSLSSVPAATDTASETSAESNQGHFSSFKVPVKIFSLDEIRSINTDTYVSGVPGLGNPHAVETMNRLSVMHWKEPMETFLNITYDLMHTILLEEVEVVFAPYQQTALYGRLQEILVNFLSSIRGEHFRQAYENYEIECVKPFTMATSVFQRAQKEAQEYLFTRRHRARAQRYAEEMAESLNKRVDPAKVTEEELGPDGYAKEIEIMAAARAYYDIASSRFVDTTCQSIHIKLFMRCREELRGQIEKELGILDENASDRCMELMVEDQERQIRRTFLQKEKGKLSKAQEWLNIAKSTV